MVWRTGGVEVFRLKFKPICVRRSRRSHTARQTGRSVGPKDGMGGRDGRGADRVDGPGGGAAVAALDLMVRLEDGTLVDGRIDFAWSDGERWTVVDYKTDRRERRRVGQLQLYALALQRSTGLQARGIVLEV